MTNASKEPVHKRKRIRMQPLRSNSHILQTRRPAESRRLDHRVAWTSGGFRRNNFAEVQEQAFSHGVVSIALVSILGNSESACGAGQSVQKACHPYSKDVVIISAEVR